MPVYQRVIKSLEERALLYRCRCSRRDLREEARYPGTCRDRPVGADEPPALRLKVGPGVIRFHDTLQGEIEQDAAQTAGDFIVRRRDGIIAYVLAVVVDDDAQGITHVVRGADLLESTPRQIYLQRLLGLSSLSYTHVPVLVEPGGEKLAKSRRSVALEPRSAARQLCTVLELFGLVAPNQLRAAAVREVWDWAQEHWHRARMERKLSLNVSAETNLP